MLPRTSTLLYGPAYERSPAPSVNPPPLYALSKYGCQCNPLVRITSARSRYASALLGVYGCSWVDFTACAWVNTDVRVSGSGACARAQTAKHVNSTNESK